MTLCINYSKTYLLIVNSPHPSQKICANECIRMKDRRYHGIGYTQHKERWNCAHIIKLSKVVHSTSKHHTSASPFPLIKHLNKLLFAFPFNMTPRTNQDRLENFLKPMWPLSCQTYCQQEQKKQCSDLWTSTRAIFWFGISNHQIALFNPSSNDYIALFFLFFLILGLKGKRAPLVGERVRKRDRVKIAMWCFEDGLTRAIQWFDP